MWRFVRGRKEPRDKAQMRRIRRIAMPMQGPVWRRTLPRRQTRNTGFYHRPMALVRVAVEATAKACARPH